MIPTISTECSDFLKMTNGVPLLKNLPIVGQGFRKVKVRQKKNDNFMESFNKAFYNQRQNLLRRAVIAHGESRITKAKDTEEAFYIFPKNGYKFMFCKNPLASTDHYKTSLDGFVNVIGNESASTIFQELLQFQYEFDNLLEGISTGSEIIIFNIPCYYAIRKSLVLDYKKLIY